MNAVPAAPVPAAAVILVREAKPTWEVFMVRRPVRSEFAPDVYVFPGGKVEPADSDPALVSLGNSDIPSGEPELFPLRVAAIRELFEETGVLLGVGDAVAGKPARDVLLDQLRSNGATLSSIVGTGGFRLALSDLRPFAHWITPESMPRRYDTWFFVARVPGGQVPLDDGQETVDGQWVSPADALRRADAGEFPLVFVTRQLLQRMARHASIEALCASVSPDDLAVVVPQVREHAGRIEFVLSGEPDYRDPGSRRDQESPTR